MNITPQPPLLSPLPPTPKRFNVGVQVTPDTESKACETEVKLTDPQKKTALKVGERSKEMFRKPVKISKMRIKSFKRKNYCTSNTTTMSKPVLSTKIQPVLATTVVTTAIATTTAANTSTAMVAISSPLHAMKRKLTLPANPEVKPKVKIPDSYFTKSHNGTKDFLETAMAVANIPIDDDDFQ